jgi:PTS system fructose-specific IIA component/PTS system nitrogen regulatory IIA component
MDTDSRTNDGERGKPHAYEPERRASSFFVHLIGYKNGMNKVGVTKAIRHHAAYNLAEAKAFTDAVLNGEKVVVEVPTHEGALLLRDEIESLGVIVEAYGESRSGERPLLEEVAKSLGFLTLALPVDVCSSPESAIRFMVGALESAGRVPPGGTEEVVQSLLKREFLGSTCLGHGQAMPRGVSTLVSGLQGVLARCKAGVPWEAPDGLPIYTICALIAPVERPGDHFRALEMVTTAMNEERWWAKQ